MDCVIQYADPALNGREAMKRKLKALVTTNPKDFEVRATYALIYSLITAAQADTEVKQDSSVDTAAGGGVAVPSMANTSLDGSTGRMSRAAQKKLEGQVDVLVGYHLWVFSINLRWKFRAERVTLDGRTMSTEHGTAAEKGKEAEDTATECDKIWLADQPAIGTALAVAGQ